jgi:DUF1365 family protein
MTKIEHLRGETFHGRKGDVANSFRYRVDYVLVDTDKAEFPGLFGRNRGNLTSVWDTDHGGAPGQGRGVHWVRDVLTSQGLPAAQKIELLAQPRVLGHVFNPVSFWFCYDAKGDLRVVIAEVTNTFNHRHSYLCHREDHGVITREDRLTATKVLYVSPFQPVEGGYQFRFDITADQIGIWIDYTAGQGGLIATLTGKRSALTNAAILTAFVRRPFGSRRVLALIHWQAFKLWLKRATFAPPPKPPVEEVSR